MICAHLRPLEIELIDRGIKEIFRGQPWTDHCREWVYYDCFLDVEKISKRIKFPPFVEHYYNDDPVTGLEEGLFCNECNDAIIGYHDSLKNKKEAETIE